MEEMDIDFDDCLPDINQKENRLGMLPVELRERAKRLPDGQEYTVLELKPEGEGHNASLLTVAATCYKMGVSYDDTLEHLQALYSPDRIDYGSAPERAVKRIWQAEGDMSKLIDGDAEAAPDSREEMLIRFRRTPITSIVELSPASVATKTPEILERLFEPSDIINIQFSALEAGTLVRFSELDGHLSKHGLKIEDYKFLNPATFREVDGVPNPLHPKNKISTRCNENVKKRDWVVLEMDSKDESRLERFNTFAMAMADYAPLVLAVDTGNKSVHFWFDAKDAPKNVRTAFFNLACLHGADKRLAVKSQIARMPATAAEREGRGPQKVIYFDPDGANTPDEWDIKGFEKFIQANKQLDYYYHSKNRQFMTRDNIDSWISLDRTSLRSHLAEKGFRETKAEGEAAAPLDLVINSIQLDKNVEAVVPGASGRHAGVYEENGHRIIVTKSPTFIKPRRGQWPTIDAFLSGLLGHDPGQLPVFYGWMQHAVRCLRNGGRRQALWAPAQMLHIIGPPNAGKTLLLQDILKPCFANRVASADPLFKKIPDMHNPDTFACELLFLDDSPVLETNYSFRQEFGERIKSHIVGIGGGMRDMHQGRINIRPWWRFVRLMNMEPSTLATLPPLDEGVEDKLILLRGGDMQDGPLGSEMRLPAWYERVKRRIEQELPAFIHFILHEFEVPNAYKDPKARFPVVSYKERELMIDINEGSVEANILHRIDSDARADLFGGGMFDDAAQSTAWEGSSERLYDILASSGSRMSQHRFAKTCPSPRILISQLRSLEKSHPHRVGYSRRLDNYPDKKAGAEYWVLFPNDYQQPINYNELSIEDMM